jgi:hypothetical protein
MALALIKCREKDRYISTGVDIAPDMWDLLAEGPRTVHCPYCRKEHAWTKRDALLVDPEQWSELPEIEDCLLRAVENSERAASAKHAKDRDFYLRIERKWLGLADGFRWIADLERRHL